MLASCFVLLHKVVLHSHFVAFGWKQSCVVKKVVIGHRGRYNNN